MSVCLWIGSEAELRALTCMKVTEELKKRKNKTPRARLHPRRTDSDYLGVGLSVIFMQHGHWEPHSSMDSSHNDVLSRSPPVDLRERP